ncbi:hypothetical protein LUZ60_015799 [Juncus effusus]|nr:hypothetical protein LUZ60_015799 [Juncus effusus]
MASHFSLSSFPPPPSPSPSPSQPKTFLLIPFSSSSQNLSVICSAYSNSNSNSNSRYKSSSTKSPNRYNRDSSSPRTNFPSRTRPPRRGNGERDGTDFNNSGPSTYTRSPRRSNGEKDGNYSGNYGTGTQSRSPRRSNGERDGNYSGNYGTGGSGTQTRPPYNSEERKRHWKAGEFHASSEERFDTDMKSGYVSKPQEKKKHWKAGEFPGVSEENFGTGTNRKGPLIKNVKKKMEIRERAKAWACTVTEALSDRIHAKDWIKALEVFEMLKEQPFYEPKEGTYMKLLVLLSRSGQPMRARQLFDEMLEEGLQATPELYTALLASFCRNNKIEEAFQILNEMKTLPLCQPDVYTYSTLIKACVDSEKFDLVNTLYEEMNERSIAPNTVTQNTVLSGYGKAGQFDEMERILIGMLESDTCKPDVWTMNIILSLFGNKGEIENMEKWYEKFRNYGIEPETRTFNILIGAYGKKKLYDKMSTVMEYMRKLNFPWTSSTYNNVIEAFADSGDAKNMEYTFNQMKAESMRPDMKTFCCLINGYSNAGLFHKVVTTVKFAEKSQMRANTSFHNAVLRACVKAGDLVEMERVFMHMKESACEPNSDTMNILTEAFRKEGLNDKIFELEQSYPALFVMDSV